MSTTNIYQGMMEDSKPSSRVLAPPGGGSSNIFGAASPQEAPAQRKNHSQSTVFGGPTQQQAPARVGRQADTFSFGASDQPTAPKAAEPKKAEEKEEEEQGKENNTAPPKPTQEAEAPANYKPKGATNPITGEACGAQNQQSSTRVKQPPGGKSSGPLW